MENVATTKFQAIFESLRRILGSSCQIRLPDKHAKNIPDFLKIRVKERKIYNDSKVDDLIEGKRKFSVEEKLHDEKFIPKSSDIVLELNGDDFDLKYVQEHGFNSPILIKSKEGLGLRMPDPDLFSVIDVKSYVGARRVLDVFDCDTHQADQMSMHHWVRYYTETSEREKILNVTSLEFSHTGLDRIVECPTAVRDDLDWVQLVWPKHLIAEQKDTTNTIDNMKYPKVRKYCLMSVAGCYTDFHIDFGGTSVWYHILKGAKVFWLIPPNENNLRTYEKWMLSERQQDVFFGDLVDNCYRVHLVAGDSFMIPTGWIHGVYTPDDSLVFGGNYLHSFNIPMQLKVYDIEEATHVPKKLRYPFFAEINWYMIKAYVDVLEKDLDERRILEFENEDGVDDDGAFKLVKEEMNGDLKQKSKTKWQCVYLTVYELEGLKLLCERFRSWTYAKVNYPKDLQDDDMELLDRLEELLQYHAEDDQILACRGINIFKQMEAAEKKVEKLTSTSPLNTPLDKVSPEKHNSSPKETMKPEEKMALEERRARAIKKTYTEKKEPSRDKKSKLKKPKKIIRRVRCQECEGCKRDNCDTCKFCVDMVKNGGTGKLRQSCALRFCMDPQLPNYVECKLCDKGKQDNVSVLMECSICAEVVHPGCMKKKAPCKISKKVNNSWECPNCCDEEEGSEFSLDQVGGVMNECKRKWQEEHASDLKEKILKQSKKSGRVNKVENLKSLIKNVKFLDKIQLDDQAEHLKNNDSSPEKKSRASEAKRKKAVRKKEETNVSNEDDSSDDEPLIKKKYYSSKSIPNGQQPTSSNGHLKKEEPIEIHKLITVVRPTPIDVYESCTMENNEDHPLKREIWIRVFSYLSTNDKLSCMLVSKSWNQWCLNSSLWRLIDISNRVPNQSMLKGIIRRQPAGLNLSSTNINGKQLEWLLKRLPHLKRLDISLNTASAASALMRITCPPLKYLNLSWCSAVYDRFLTQILAPLNSGSNSNVEASRLQYMETLDLTGCNISDETVNYIFSKLCTLRHLTVSHCPNVTDACLNLLIKKDTNCPLEKFVCVGCSVTEKAVPDFLRDVVKFYA